MTQAQAAYTTALQQRNQQVEKSEKLLAQLAEQADRLAAAERLDVRERGHLVVLLGRRHAAQVRRDAKRVKKR